MNYLSNYNMQTPSMQPMTRQSVRPGPMMQPVQANPNMLQMMAMRMQDKRKPMLMQQAMTQPRIL